MSTNRRARRPRPFIPLLQARKLRRRLTPEQQDYIDRVAAQKWSVTQYDVELARAAAERQIQEDAKEYGFDPATIILLVQLAWLIFQALKYLELLEAANVLVVGEILATDTIDDYEAEDQVTG